ncbi:MAG: tRNA (adenosine(37)-N6)-dimethylallyltransferase MiaA [Patescibacteria group bacterium]
MNKIIVISGPTGSGKTELSLALANKYGGFIINADSRTIYKELDIATAKPTKAQQKKIKHYLIDIKKPDNKFTVFDFKQAADRLIKTHKNLPFIVGGAGLYITSLIENWRLGTRQKSKAKYEVLLLVLNPPRDQLYQRINKRVEKMWRTGLIAETKRLRKKYNFNQHAFTGIGYREVAKYLSGTLTKQQAIQEMQKQSRHYAKRQLTWWRSRDNVYWITSRKQAEKLLEIFIKEPE